MAGREEPYDPYIPSGSAPSGGRTGDQGGTAKTAAIQAQINDTVQSMKQNIKSVEQRGQHIDEMNAQADRLQVNSKQFSRKAHKVRLNETKKNLLWGLGILILIAIVIAIIVVIVKKV